jgi:hypothetical protein
MPQPLAPILPTAPEVSIVTSARRIPGLNDDAWVYGISHREDFCREVRPWGRCVEEGEGGYPEVTVDPLGDDDFPEFRPWTIYSSFTCTSLAKYAEARKSAVETLKAKTPYAVTQELWTGVESGSLSLRDVGTDISNEDPQPIEDVLADLGGNFDDCSGGMTPTFHVPTRALPRLYDTGQVSRSGDRLVTPTGGVVIPGGPNVPGAYGPAGSGGYAESVDGEVWVYVTGPIELEFSETWERGSGEVPVATFARLNRSELLVQRDAIFRFPTCCVFAARAALA